MWGFPLFSILNANTFICYDPKLYDMLGISTYAVLEVIIMEQAIIWEPARVLGIFDHARGTSPHFFCFFFGPRHNSTRLKP